jgi:hypothetical protein
MYALICGMAYARCPTFSAKLSLKIALLRHYNPYIMDIYLKQSILILDHIIKVSVYFGFLLEQFL